MTTKTTCEYRVEVKGPRRLQDSDGTASVSTTTIAKAYCGARCIGRFSGIHAQKQAEALIVMAQAGATEASLSLCAADIGRAALHELSVKYHPEFDEISSCI